MYQLPIKDNDEDFLKKTPAKVEMKTFGLPYVFWFYAFVFSLFLAFLGTHAYPIAQKLLASSHPIDQSLGYGLVLLVFGLFFAQFAFLFFGKKVVSTKEFISVSYTIGPITFFKRTIHFAQDPDHDNLVVAHHLDSPNMARIQNKPNTQGFQNRGYFVLMARNDKGKLVEIDRHSLKKDLEKIKEHLTL